MKMSDRYWIARKTAWISFAAPFCLAFQIHANVVTDWNAVASTAIVTNGGQSPGASSVFFAYVSLAEYDAVNAITGQYRPFYYRSEGPADASIDAAVVTAAHRVLVNYFPAQQSALDSQYATSLAGITADPAAKSEGVAVGEAARTGSNHGSHGRRSRGQCYLYSGIRTRRVDPDASRLCTSGDPMVRPDAAVHDESPRRLSAGPAALRFQRDVCPGLQSDAVLWRNYQQYAFRRGSRDRTLLDRAYWTAIRASFQLSGQQLQSRHGRFGEAHGDAVDRIRGLRHRVLQCQIQVRLLEACDCH